MSVNLRIKRNRLYLDIYHKGVRRWETLDMKLPKDTAGKRETLAQAEEMRKKRELQLAAERYQLLDPVASKQTLIAYAEDVAKGYDKQMHLPKSLRYLRAYAGGVLLCDVDEHFCDGFRAFLLNQKTLSPATAKHYVDAFKGLLNQAERDRLIGRSPAKGMKAIRVPEQKRPFLTIEEIQRLYNTPAVGGELAEECRRGFLFSCFTGLRVSDIKSLTWGDISRDGEPTIIKQMVKTQNVISVPLAPSAWKLIDDKRLHRRDELVFPRLTEGHPNLYRPLDKWRKKAGIDHEFGWHAGRHSFAVMTLEASKDVFSVSRLLGHSDVATTTKYLHLLDPRKKEIIDSLPALDDETQHGEIVQIRTGKK